VVQTEQPVHLVQFLHRVEVLAVVIAAVLVVSVLMVVLVAEVAEDKPQLQTMAQVTQAGIHQ
jgi:hypothetical protein